MFSFVLLPIGLNVSKATLICFITDPAGQRAQTLLLVQIFMLFFSYGK